MEMESVSMTCCTLTTLCAGSSSGCCSHFLVNDVISGLLAKRARRRSTRDGCVAKTTKSKRIPIKCRHLRLAFIIENIALLLRDYCRDESAARYDPGGEL